MLRCLVVLIGLLITSGCVIMAGTPSIHPHSQIMAPTFCLHGGKSEPLPITGIAVERGEKVNDERIEWSESAHSMAGVVEGRRPPSMVSRIYARRLCPTGQHLRLHHLR